MKTFKKKIKMIVEKTDTGFSAYSNDYNVFTTGKTIPELVNKAYEAANLFFEDSEINITHENVLFEIDFKQFFQHYKVLKKQKSLICHQITIEFW